MGLAPEHSVPKRRKTLAKNYLTKYSSSLGIRKIKIRTTFILHFTTDRMANINKTTNNKSLRGFRETQHSFNVGGYNGLNKNDPHKLIYLST